MSRHEVDLEFDVPEEPSARMAFDMLLWQLPRIPRLSNVSKPPRWDYARHWIPFATRPLVRHVRPGTADFVVTEGDIPPPGFETNWHLGAVSLVAHPETRRLVQDSEGRFSTVEDWEALPAGAEPLGFVGTVPFPMLHALEVRRLASGVEVLTAGTDDPLLAATEPVTTLGFIEPYPIAPRQPPPPSRPWTFVTLRRRLDAEGWRHRYLIGDDAHPTDVRLGAVRRFGGPEYIELRRGPWGGIETERLPERRSRASLGLPKWVLAPARWSGAGRWRRIEATSDRLRAVRERPWTRAGAQAADEHLGWLRAEPGPGWVALYRATHPVTGDQYVTRSELEARDMGYRVDGVLGYVGDRDVDRVPGPREIPWASRFGWLRRYVEQPAPPLSARRRNGNAAPSVNRAALLSRAASGLATLDLEPGGTRTLVERPEARRAVAVAVSGSDAALLALACPSLEAWALAHEDAVVVLRAAAVGEAVDPEALRAELAEDHDAVAVLVPGTVLEPGADPFAEDRPGVLAPDADAAFRARFDQVARWVATLG
ncbi:hypothetical protein [Conexibacter sp. SYSU D00693]|uniref:hypothetical protein n=1 Tax=Conexibacter sp. SYSU D00693 TaxID=2812560 RepID=UPI00196A2F25|nr:hypothetical protein [Conexibacter sp. SYSU D00693]